MKLFLPWGVMLFLICMKRKKLLPAGLFLILSVLCIVSGILTFSEVKEGRYREVTSVTRKGDGSDDETVPLVAETEGGQRADVEIRIPGLQMTGEEAEEAFAEAAAELDEILPGKNSFFERIEYDMELPGTLPGSPVEITWQTDRPSVLSWEGKIGEDIPVEGEEVRLSAGLYLDGYKSEYIRILKVFPSRENAALAARLRAEADLMNGGKASDNGTFRLPSSLDGEAVRWYLETSEKGPFSCLAVFLLAILLILNIRQKEEKKEEERKERLVREYPELVSRLQLLLGAGLSLRYAMQRIGSENTGRTLSGEEAERCWYEMETGVLEQDAYMHFGERCGTPEYRRLALLLAQSQKKGGQILSRMLERETQDAYESRKRKARAEGEKNAVRMILPMGMMLAVVLIIVMVPAVLSF